MMTVEVKVNNRLIADIYIHNTGRVDEWGQHLYEVRFKDEDYKTEFEVKHLRERSYLLLIRDISAVAFNEKKDNFVVKKRRRKTSIRKGKKLKETKHGTN